MILASTLASSAQALLAFADAGYLTMAESPRSPFGFLDGSLGDWKKSVGIGISGESLVPYLGIYAAQDLDAGSFSPRFIIRIERSF